MFDLETPFTSPLLNYFIENIKMLFGVKQFSEVLKRHKQLDIRQFYCFWFLSKHSLELKTKTTSTQHKERLYIFT